MRWLKFTAACVAAAAAAVFTAVHLGNWELRRRDQRIEQLERERADLVRYAERLSASRRVAQVDVLSQKPDPAGVPVTTVRWQEVNQQGVRGAPQTVEAHGEQLYFEAYTLKFEPQRVGRGDAERSVSLALFRRIFGDRQSPDSALEIDRAAQPPDPLEPDERRISEDHRRLWTRFWEMVDDPKVAAQYGVRVAQCEAVSARMKPGQVWEISLDAIGGLNLRKLSGDVR